jgi:hypothetical protein
MKVGELKMMLESVSDDMTVVIPDWDSPGFFLDVGGSAYQENVQRAAEGGYFDPDQIAIDPGDEPTTVFVITLP